MVGRPKQLCVSPSVCTEQFINPPRGRKRRVPFWGIPAARGAQCQQRGCPAEPTAPSGRAPGMGQTGCAGTGLPPLMRRESRDQPALWRGNLSGGYRCHRALGPSHSTCFLGPASPAKRVKPSRLPAAELLWLLVLDKNIDFLWCCAMHVRWTGVISSHALRRRGEGRSERMEHPLQLFVHICSTLPKFIAGDFYARFLSSFYFF